MKIFVSLLFLFSGITLFGQKPTAFEKHAADSLKAQLSGSWYLSAIYTFDFPSKRDYVTATDVQLRLEITKDSIFFIEPRERFYYSRDEHIFKYKVGFRDRYRGQTIDLLEAKSKKISATYHFTLLGDELILSETLGSKGYSLLNMERQYVYTRAFDSLQLETKLQYNWSTNDIKELDLSKASDTIVFTRTSEAPKYTNNYSIQFYREPDWYMKAHINLVHSTDNEGVLIHDKGSVVLHPKDRQIELITSQGTWFFRVILVDDEQLVLVRQPG